MLIHWTDSSGAGRSAEIPQHILPIVEAIGIDATAELLMNCGGAQAYIASKSNGGIVEQAIGKEASRKLVRALGSGSLRIPTGKSFLARVLRGRGRGTAEIARTLHVTDVCVRKYLNPKISRAA